MREPVRVEGAETFAEKGLRKMKQQPLVPLGVLATTIAIIGATRSMQSRNRDRTSFNRWLRFRIVAQCVTVAACVAGTWIWSADARRKRSEDSLERKKDDVEKERRRFEARLAEAEEMQRIEDEAARGVAIVAIPPEATDKSTSSGHPWRWGPWPAKKDPGENDKTKPKP